MTLLQWRRWRNRAALLAELNSDACWADIGPDEQAPASSRAQELEDARLGVPLAQAPARHPLHVYRRRPDSTVWHAGPECPAWPAVEPWVELVGGPWQGQACARCGEREV